MKRKGIELMNKIIFGLVILLILMGCGYGDVGVINYEVFPTVQSGNIIGVPYFKTDTLCDTIPMPPKSLDEMFSDVAKQVDEGLDSGIELISDMVYIICPTETNLVRIRVWKSKGRIDDNPYIYLSDRWVEHDTSWTLLMTDKDRELCRKRIKWYREAEKVWGKEKEKSQYNPFEGAKSMWQHNMQHIDDGMMDSYKWGDK